MKKEVLIQYTDLQEEIKELEESKRITQKKLDEFLKNGTVTDMVTGGAGGIQHFKIEGFPVVDYERTRRSIERKIQRIEDRYADLLELTNEVEEYIDSIDDSRMRRIISHRFIDKRTWGEISAIIGDGSTEDSIKKSFYRFIGE